MSLTRHQLNNRLAGPLPHPDIGLQLPTVILQPGGLRNCVVTSERQSACPMLSSRDAISTPSLADVVNIGIKTPTSEHRNPKAISLPLVPALGRSCLRPYVPSHPPRPLASTRRCGDGRAVVPCRPTMQHSPYSAAQQRNPPAMTPGTTKYRVCPGCFAVGPRYELTHTHPVGQFARSWQTHARQRADGWAQPGFQGHLELSSSS